MRRSIAILAILWALSGCSGDDSTTSPQLSRFNQRSNGDFVTGHPRAIVISNPYGAIIVDGQNLDTTGTWFLDTWVLAASQESASEQLSSVHLRCEPTDTAYHIRVEASVGMTRLDVLLSVTLPQKIPCVVTSVHGETTVSGLHAEFVGKAMGAVHLSSHSASCDISSVGGPIEIQIELPDSGYCFAQAATADISLKIPTTTSATLSAITSAGAVSCSGLQLSGQTAQPGMLTGSIGEGRGRIVLATGSGNISIRGF
ncbi:MAG: hypothetical protein IT282_09680 [Bacteroidetes bacterium]|nr:hypothetical protein [Bacteroidota bacterium]